MSLDSGGWIGRYRLLERLSEGGSGEVWLATIPGTGEPVVIKRLRAHLRDNAQLILRLKHEATVAVLIDDPRIVRVLDVGEVGGDVYLSMEYVTGWTIGRLLQITLDQSIALPITVVRDLVGGILRGLGALHSVVHPETREPLMAVHRDIAPRNVMLTPTGEIKILDLGLGKSNIQDWTTRVGAAIGTPGYMAPEQLLARPSDRRTDVYSTFVLGFELLLAERYVPRGAPKEIIERCLAGPFRPPSSLRQDLDPRIDEVFKKGLAIRPEERFADAADALRAIEGIWGPSGAVDVAGLPSPFLPESAALLSKARALAASVADDSPEEQQTTVYARRADSALTPVSLTTPAGLPEDLTKIERPSLPSTELLPRPPPPAAPSSPVVARVPVIGAAALLVFGVSVGIWISPLWTTPRPPSPSVETAAVPQPKATPPVIAQPRAPPEVEPPVADVAIEPKPRSKQSGRPDRSKVPSTALPVADRPAAKVAPVTYEALIAETVALRRARPELAPGIDEIVIDAALWQRAPIDERSTAALGELRNELRRLEQRR